MKPPLRFAEAVCAGHPDRLADTIADRIVDLAVRRDPNALVGVEVALHRSVVFIDGRIASGDGEECAVSEEEVREIPRAVFREAGYGRSRVGFDPSPECLRVELDLCLGPLEADERSFRQVSDDQVIAVGYACQGERAGLVPLEQALARDFARAMEDLHRGSMRELLGPDGKVLIAVRGRRLEAVSLSVHHEAKAEWGALVFGVKEACLAVAAEYVETRELEPPDETVSWLFNGAGSFAVGGPMGDNGLSGKKLVAEAFGTAVPIGGGTIHGKDPRTPDVRASAMARERAVSLVRGGAREATVWVVFRPGDEEPAWVEEQLQLSGPIAAVRGDRARIEGR